MKELYQACKHLNKNQACYFVGRECPCSKQKIYCIIKVLTSNASLVDNLMMVRRTFTNIGKQLQHIVQRKIHYKNFVECLCALSLNVTEQYKYLRDSIDFVRSLNIHEVHHVKERCACLVGARLIQAVFSTCSVVFSNHLLWIFSGWSLFFSMLGAPTMTENV